MKKFAVLCFAVTSIACSPPDQAPVQTAADQRRDAVITGLRLPVIFEGEGGQRFSIGEGLARSRASGFSVAVLKGGVIDWSAGYGTLAAGSDRVVTTQTMFQAASISKPVTVLAVLRMHEAGLIDLDRDINSYLKEFEIPPGPQTADNPVTFRNLLAHMSGAAPGGYPGYAISDPVPTDVETLKGRPPAKTDPIEIIAAPGAQLAYSGQGYTLVELALQDIFGESFETIMKSWVFEPLDMQRSSFAQPLPEAIADDVASGHLDNGTPVPGGWRIYPEQAAAGLWTTADDLAKTLLAIHQARSGESDFLSVENANSLLVEQMDGHAFGFVLSGTGRERAIRHYGGNDGYRAMMILYPETGDGAVFLVNSNSGLSVIGEVARAVSDVYHWPDFNAVTASRVELDRNEMMGFVGTYRFESGVEVGITYSAGKNALSAVFPNGDIYQLTPTGPASFIHPDTAVTIEFDDEGRLIVYGDKGVKAA